MKIACLAAFASLRGALLLAALASFAGAQTQTWIRQFGTNANESPCAAAPDGSGGVFTSGWASGSLGGANAGGFDAWVAHHDDAGTLTWIRQFGTNAHDIAYGVAPAASGGVFVCGLSEGGLGGSNAGSEDAWLARYGGTGNQTWIRQFGTSADDIAYAAVSDGADGVYVSGVTGGSLGGPNSGGGDAWLAHYDGAGNQTWIRQFGTGAFDGAFAAAPDGVGGVFVSGSTGGSLGGPALANGDVWLAHYDGAGNQSWIRQLGTDRQDGPGAVVPDGVGGVFVSGWTRGNLGGLNAGGVDAWLARYDGAGNQVWIRQLGTPEYDAVHAAAPDGSGGVYVSGSTQGDFGGPNVGSADVWLAHHDGAGDQTWIRQFGSTSFETVYGAALDGAGGVFVVGETQGSLGGPIAGFYDAWVTHYDGFFAARYCTPAPSNSTGRPGRLSAAGSNAVNSNSVTLLVDQLPTSSFGFFLTSMPPGFIANPGGSQGNLCLGGNIGRFVGPGQIMNSGPSGSFQLVLDLTQTPQPAGFVSVTAGQTWNFQAWYRDANPGPTSNFTDAVSVTFN